MVSGRFLGIDFGEKRIGLAISSETGTLAFPKDVLLNNEDIFLKLGAILEEEKISEIVIGDSLNFSGRPNKVAKEIENFIRELENRFKLPVRKEKEFLTSVEARGRAGKESLNARKAKKVQQGRVDARAAALILQRHLDRRHKNILE